MDAHAGGIKLTEQDSDVLSVLLLSCCICGMHRQELHATCHRNLATKMRTQAEMGSLRRETRLS